MINSPRLLLAKVRSGDYAHAGDEQSIDMMLEKIPDLMPIKTILDVGCGLGGTANYIKNKLNAEVFGIDIDANAIKHAKNKYPDVRIFEGDIHSVDQIFKTTAFDLIYFFNVFYAIQDKFSCLNQFAKISKPGTMLVIFDYFQSEKKEYQLFDLAGKKMHLVAVEELTKFLAQTGWKTIETLDVTTQYIKWYRDFLDKLIKMKTELLTEFSLDTFNKVHKTFSQLLADLEQNKINGFFVFARM